MGHKHLYILLVFLLISTTQVRFRAGGSMISRLLQAINVEGGEKMFVRARIGSRPPDCERRCSSCGHCKAVQMPVVPQDGNGRRRSSRAFTANSRGKDTSNYKPMSWKCKCGDMIFNP